jgi:hypothetical protein
VGRIRKSYYALRELTEAWELPQADVRYLAETGLLTVSVLMVGALVELGCYEPTADGNAVSGPFDRCHHDGLLDLHKRDVARLFREGEIAPRHFRIGDGYARLLCDDDVLAIRASDLLVRDEERRRFQRETLPQLSSNTVDYGDFTDFVVRGRRYRFTATQARVLSFLHKAAESGRPWQPGKAALAASGSNSLKLCHLFKRHPKWRDLVETDGHGRYRLLLPICLPLAA